jgi:hypothetical protein
MKASSAFTCIFRLKEKQKRAPTKQPPKPQDTDISRCGSTPRHAGIAGNEVVGCGFDSSFMGTHSLVCEYFSKEAWRVRCNKKKGKK